jgi:SAM-dependent methyltransferase
LFQPLIKSIAMMAPPLRRLLDQRDRLAAQCRTLERERDGARAELARLGPELATLRDEQTRHESQREAQARKLERRSNVEHWKRLQDRDYFEHHPCYQGLHAFGSDAVEAIERFIPLERSQKVVVIGCGYGRDTVQIAPRVDHVWGIDVSRRILDKALAFTREQGVENFTPVLADEYKEGIPDGIDIVFSVVVMQHLTRYLVREYFALLAAKLASRGVFVVQFVEELFEGVEAADAELADHEPSVSWTARQLAGLAGESGLALREIRTVPATATALWHWACFARPGESG